MKSHYESLLRAMPPGLDRAVLRVLSKRIGREMALSRGELVYNLGAIGFKPHERQVRETIRDLRRKGHLICSAPGEKGGYWIAKDRTEFEEFIHNEFQAKINDMAETERAMRRSADLRFGEWAQGRLF